MSKDSVAIDDLALSAFLLISTDSADGDVGSTFFAASLQQI